MDIWEGKPGRIFYTSTVWTSGVMITSPSIFIERFIINQRANAPARNIKMTTGRTQCAVYLIIH